MACTDKFKHVCFGDLEEYLRRDSYFSDFSKDEIDTIRRNLGFTTTQEDFNIIEDTYANIYDRLQKGKLNVSCAYIINDFRTIYLEDNRVCGTDDFLPSKQYKLMLRPSSINSFDKKVFIISPEAVNWEVEYDITPKRLNDAVTTKGTIIYLKDQYNNSAYYDFKNIRFKKTMEELNKGATAYDSDQYMYTFNIGGKEGSQFCKNNRLGQRCTANVFLGLATNNILDTECHHNLFFSTATNNIFRYGTYNNYFKSAVISCSGIVHDKELSEITSSNTIKQFDFINNEQYIIYIDSQTLTQQIQQL